MAAGYFTMDGSDDNLIGADDPSFDFTGPFTLLACIRTASTLANDPIIDRLSSSAGYRLYILSNAGELQLAMGSGTVETFFSSSVGGLTADTDVWVRAIGDPDNGSNSTADFSYSYDPPETPVGSVSWSALGTQQTDAQTSIGPSADALWLGNNHDGEGDFRTGRTYYAEVWDDVTRVANPDFRNTSQGDWTAVSPTGTDDEGISWSQSGDPVYTAEVTVGSFAGYRLASNSQGYITANRDLLISQRKA